MIVVTRLDKREFAVNPDLIERIHASPDTTLHMADGSTYIVAETMAQVIELTARYRAYVIGIARHMSATDAGAPALSVVPPEHPAEEQALASVRLPPRK